VEYYDRNMIRLTRENGPNLFIYKTEIAYISEGGKEGSKRQAVRSRVSAPEEDASVE
jgi:hypothetical protein